MHAHAYGRSFLSVHRFPLLVSTQDNLQYDLVCTALPECSAPVEHCLQAIQKTRDSIGDDLLLDLLNTDTNPFQQALLALADILCKPAHLTAAKSFTWYLGLERLSSESDRGRLGSGLVTKEHVEHAA